MNIIVYSAVGIATLLALLASFATGYSVAELDNRYCNSNNLCVGDRVKVIGGGDEAGFLNICKLTVKGLQATSKANLAWLVVDCGVRDGEFKIGTAEVEQETLAIEPLRKN